MRKTEVCRKQVITESGDAITLVYSLAVDELSADGSDYMLENYGVCIDIPERGDSALLRGITVSAARINALAELISDNLVTPCTLYDVTYDWLCGF